MEDKDKESNSDADAGWKLADMAVLPSSLASAWDFFKAGDMPAFARTLSLWAVAEASNLFNMKHSHDIVLLVMRDMDFYEVITEDTVVDAIRSSGNIPKDVAKTLKNKLLKTLLSKMASALAQTMDANAVVHIAEAWMASVPIEARNDPTIAAMMEAVMSGKTNVRDLPNKYIAEALIVRTELKSGLACMVRRVIKHDDGNTPVLGPIEIMEDLEEDANSPGKGKFSDYWNPENADGVAAVGMANPGMRNKVSAASWDFDSVKTPDKPKDKS